MSTLLDFKGHAEKIGDIVSQITWASVLKGFIGVNNHLKHTSCSLSVLKTTTVAECSDRAHIKTAYQLY